MVVMIDCHTHGERETVESSTILSWLEFSGSQGNAWVADWRGTGSLIALTLV